LLFSPWVDRDLGIVAGSLVLVGEVVGGFVVGGCFVELFEALLVVVLFEDLFALGGCEVGYIDGD
jgi:hypothetical protein